MLPEVTEAMGRHGLLGMRYRVEADSVTAVSSGIVDPSDAWRPVPNDAVLRVKTRTLATTVAPVVAPPRDGGIGKPGGPDGGPLLGCEVAECQWR